MIFIFLAESPPRAEGWGEGGWLEDEENGGGSGGRDGQRLAVVGRASKPVVQTSGPMEATLVF